MPNVSRGRRGLRKLPPELIAQAQDQTAATITRIMLTFVGVALFCLLSLLTPDVALLTGGERVNVPFAGPVSFLGFLVIGPAVLITLRAYLQIYVEHWRRLEPIRRRVPVPGVPTVAPLENSLLRAFARFVLFLLLPLRMLAFTWKAAVLPPWGRGLLCVTAGVIAGHLMLPLGWRWRWKAAILVVALLAASEWPVSRPANLIRTDLSDQWLPNSHLQGANLEGANLKGANLRRANLAGTDLTGANFEGSALANANLEGANVSFANLEDATFYDGVITRLGGAHLIEAMRLAQAQLDRACGDNTTKLPAGLSIRPCAR